MQRKNNLLNSIKPKFKKGMALIMAIAVIVILATIMALSLSLTTQTTKKTTDLYVYEQAVLLSQSAAEYALLRISKVNPCSLDNFNFRPDLNGDGSTADDIYDITITFNYIYNDPSICTTATAYPGFTLVSEQTNGTVLMDITVSSDVGTEPIRYFRRSIQKL